MNNNSISHMRQHLSLFKGEKEAPKFEGAPMEDFEKSSNFVTLGQVEFPFTEGKLIYRQDSKSESKIPCIAFVVTYEKVLYKSSQRGHDLEVGWNINIHGLDIQASADGSPVLDDNEEYVLLNKDDEGNPLSEHQLMQFRPYYGRDNSQRGVQDKDSLILIPFNGVPKKGVKRTNKAGEEYDAESVAWELIPGLENLLKKPLLNIGVERLPYVDDQGNWLNEEPKTEHESMVRFLWEMDQNLPVTSNAPSRMKEKLTQQATGNAPTKGTTSNAANPDDDPFTKGS